MLRPKPNLLTLNRRLPLVRKLLGAWEFNERGGSVVHDRSGHKANLAITGTTVEGGWTLSKMGPFFDFNPAGAEKAGTIGPVTTYPHLNRMTYFAWEMWLYPPANDTGNNTIFIWDGSAGLYLVWKSDGDLGRMRFGRTGTSQGNMSTANSVPYGDVTHVVVVVAAPANWAALAAGDVVCYINGIKNTDPPDNDGTPTTAGDLCIVTPTYNRKIGVLSARMWTYLTPDEVGWLYRNPWGIYDTDFPAYKAPAAVGGAATLVARTDRVQRVMLTR